MSKKYLNIHFSIIFIFIIIQYKKTRVKIFNYSICAILKILKKHFNKFCSFCPLKNNKNFDIISV